MSAFNTVKHVDVCPHCKQFAQLDFQTHVSSSFHGDSDGHFHDRAFFVGEKMRWFEPSDERYAEWTELAEVRSDGSVIEHCYGECSVCHTELEASITFCSLSPVKIDCIKTSA